MDWVLDDSKELLVIFRPMTIILLHLKLSLFFYRCKI